MSIRLYCIAITAIFCSKIYVVESSYHNCTDPYGECRLPDGCIYGCNLDCDPFEDCIIECNGNFVCKYLDIGCPPGHACNITCYGQETCTQLKVNATMSTELYMHCERDGGRDSCMDADIYCPQQQIGEPKCHITGNDDTVNSCGDLACDHRYSLVGLNFFAINGFLDMDLFASSKYGNMFIPAIMHCGIGYDKSCDIGPVWQCNGNTNCDFTTNPTTIPTQNPTTTPTKNPSDDPTLFPTSHPTTYPTIYPTHQPTTDPTTNPTNIPSFIPTVGPSNDPTTDPTNDPTNDPTTDPTIEPTIVPTIVPTTWTPTLAPISKPTLEGIEIIESTINNQITQIGTINSIDDAYDSQAQQIVENVFFKSLTAYVGLVLLIITILSYIYSRYYARNDFYRVTAVITACLHILDFISDVSFSIQTLIVSSITNVIFICSIIFILLPLCFSLYQLYSAINKRWMKKSNNELKSWLANNVTLLYFLSIITGSSFSAIELCYSNLFNLNQFDIPLSKTHIMLFKTHRIYSVIALENLPQIVLQICYIQIFGAENVEIVYISLVFSSISILIAILSSFTQKTVINQMDYVEIQFDVIGSAVSAKSYLYKNIVTIPQRRIAGILGTDKNITEISRPKKIPNGLCIKMKLYISISKAIDLNCENVLQNARDSGDLGKLFQDAWTLSSIPKIENIKSQQINSKKRGENMIRINSNDVELNKLDTSNEPGQIAMTEIINVKNEEGVVSIVNATHDHLINTNINQIPQVANVINYPLGANQVNSYDSDSSNTPSNNYTTDGKNTIK